MPKALPKRFTDQTSAREHLEGLLWPNGPICPHCSSVATATKLKGQSTRPGVYWCNVCQKPFSVTVGTVYERSKVPLHTWLYATHLLCSSKKGISSQQLARMLGVTVKTAWFMSHRIREAMNPAANADPLGGQGQIVEADDTELGRSNKTRPRPRSKNLKFVSLVERGGKVRSRKLTGAKGSIGGEIRAALYTNVNRASTLHTDGGSPLKTAWPIDRHSSVDHNKRFVGVDADANPVHTNTAEGFFSIFKRGLVGTYQHMSEQHLSRYLAEFDFRMSYRVKLGYSDDMRADIALQGIAGKRLMYRRPHAT
ncbi:MAG TPA: IS1595 family transposase [Rhizomicrobium sp.]|jgi:transposase-like protein|nr:IS1595 family transposase [Rhizomicrobium sp.]